MNMLRNVLTVYVIGKSFALASANGTNGNNKIVNVLQRIPMFNHVSKMKMFSEKDTH